MPNLGRPSVNENKSANGKNNSHTKNEILKAQRPEQARDDIGGAFAGKQNEDKGTVTDGGSSTHVKSRQTQKSKERTPIR